MVPLIDIAVESPRWTEAGNEGEDPLSLDALVEAAIGAAVARAGIALHAEAEVSLLFCDDAFIRGLNHQWRGLDKPTNVLSFPSDEDLEDARLLGDIIIAFETSAGEAKAEAKSLAAHVSHLVVHGFLHLIGYDHEEAEEAEEMERMEQVILADLGIADPYHGTAPVAPGGEAQVPNEALETSGKRQDHSLGEILPGGMSRRLAGS
ncbi:rRNA maturation RNase YbeY [Beijerinckia indica]|uniref:Endoribonuclease YbeY n=1 Tax=Beijerinckia indica subsp. indica (strain ATCC 9039 / DSM 1715 / NCIMB 8712) TaxID=395963 RepID=YBEY_BEII9|nr:rRNA maturation RNase YbeY [Beijerinckia indica]B2IIK7.1 RecName: Full=Endoribonuclease YbeY [Beijerinckia indica subsp. indica ATCC 9039]ACB94700.1 protein of unknown function UPF0054 [Beijerinckia indica subsp. indica ATCC 9039]